MLASILLLISPFYNANLRAEDWLRVGVFVIVSLAISLKLLFSD